MTGFLVPYLDYGPEWGPLLLRAMGTTVLLSGSAFALALVLGLVLALARDARSPALRRLVSLAVTATRGVPVLAILFLIYFGLPGIGVTVDAFTSAALGLALAFGAQVAELIRAGLAAIPRGQREAAMAVGLTPVQAFTLITLPQVVRVITPALLVTFVSLMKDSSLASLITVNELVLTGRALATEYFLPLQIYLAVGLCYFLIAWPISLLSRRLAPPTLR